VRSIDGHHDRLQVVDGQQRLTTISILLMALRDSGKLDEKSAEQLTEECLFHRWENDLRLHLNEADQRTLRAIYFKKKRRTGIVPNFLKITLGFCENSTECLPFLAKKFSMQFGIWKS